MPITSHLTYRMLRDVQIWMITSLLYYKLKHMCESMHRLTVSGINDGFIREGRNSMFM